jgi:hypothetical protein
METLKSLRQQAKVSYLGATKKTVKMRLSYEHGTETYCLYLAPADMSGHNVCPVSKYCKRFCLNGSGQNKIQQLAGKNGVNSSRIKKTNLFFENRDLFMKLLIKEIRSAKEHALKNGLGFSVRLNGTSDLSPEEFTYMGKNILEIFPDVQFYDYTKVPTRFELTDKYNNYDLTYSFNGYNWSRCEQFLKQGGKVAVVFDGPLPDTFHGFKVTDANQYDMRYLDPKGHIMGLHYHPTAGDFKDGHYVHPSTRFVVNVKESEHCA